MECVQRAEASIFGLLSSQFADHDGFLPPFLSESVFPVEGLLAVLPCLEPDRVDLGPEGAENVQQAQLTIGLCDVCPLAAVGDKRGLLRRYGLRQGAGEEFPEQRQLESLITGPDGCVGLSSPVWKQDLNPHLIGDGPGRSESTLIARGEALAKGADQSFRLRVRVSIWFFFLLMGCCAGPPCPLVAE